MKKNNDKKKTRPLSLRARKALKLMVEKGRSQRSALREAGYSDAVANQPGKVTSQKGFIEALEKVGLTDTYLAKGYKEFTRAGELREYVFHHKKQREIVDIDEDSPIYNKSEGAVNKQEIVTLVPVSDKIIKDRIGRISGAELIDIQDHEDKRVAFYQKPDFTARKTGYELASKVKGHLQPDQINTTVQHSMSEDDRKFMQSIFNN
jgi:hypothetical protein